MIGGLPKKKWNSTPVHSLNQSFPQAKNRSVCWKKEKGIFDILKGIFLNSKGTFKFKSIWYVSYVNKHFFFFFLLKGKKKGAIVEWRETRVLFILWKGGRAQVSSETVWGKLCINAGLLNWKSAKLTFWWLSAEIQKVAAAFSL